jgi:hypothetical protein
VPLRLAHPAEFHLFYRTQACPFHPAAAMREAVQEASRYVESLASYLQVLAGVNYHRLYPIRKSPFDQKPQEASVVLPCCTKVKQAGLEHRLGRNILAVRGPEVRVVTLYLDPVVDTLEPADANHRHQDPWVTPACHQVDHLPAV